MKVTLSGAPDSSKSGMQNYLKRLESKEDINR
jgi:hypothetical protein